MTAAPGNRSIIFEHPLSERVRSYLRLESLFCRFGHCIAGECVDLHHLALHTLFEIMDCAARAELKLNLLKDLEKQKSLAQNAENPENLQILQTALVNLQQTQHRFGQVLRENEWLMAIRQRITISGGTVPIDLPSYFFWQGMDCAERRSKLQSWAQTLIPTGEAVRILMANLRRCADSGEHIARAGNYQQSGLGKGVHLLQIEVARDFCVMPEISANRHMMHIHFVHMDFEHIRGKQTEKDIPFRLALARLHCEN